MAAARRSPDTGTKTVSLRLPREDLQRFSEAQVDLTEFIRDAVHQKARELWLDRWLRDVRENLIPMPPGAPTSTELIRQMRDER